MRTRLLAALTAAVLAVPSVFDAASASSPDKKCDESVSAEHNCESVSAEHKCKESMSSEHKCKEGKA